MSSAAPMFTNVPGAQPIELVAYYPEFAFYYPNCEPETKRWFVENAGKDWVFLDCGANIGYFSILFSRLAPGGKIFAFEPTETARMMEKNLAHHRATNVSIMQVALGSVSGQLTENIYRIWGESPERKEYPFTTIDDFVAMEKLDRVDCIKIDVDSFDFEVLRGARETLIAKNPFIVVELNHALSRRNQSNTQAIEWLADLGYQMALVLDDDNFILKRGIDPGETIGERRSIRLAFPASSPEAVPHAPALSNEQTDAKIVENMPVGILPIDELQTLLGFSRPIDYPQSSRQRPLVNWDAERDDGPILRYIFRNFAPKRHLEFGTWYGDGVLRCVEECDASVWTLNLYEGELSPEGSWAYATQRPASLAIPEWAETQVVETGTYYRTDSRGFIGLNYRQRGFGHRVCQILCDSREWDTRHYPRDFFDSAFIDGGHQYDVVKSDTYKAIELLRPGGLILWHDFVLDETALANCSSPRDVIAFVKDDYRKLTEQLSALVWIQPSWLLLGIKK